MFSNSLKMNQTDRNMLQLWQTLKNVILTYRVCWFYCIVYQCTAMITLRLWKKRVCSCGYLIPFSMARQAWWAKASSLLRFRHHTQDTPHVEGLLWASDRPVAETSTWKHTTLKRDTHSRSRRGSNPQSRQANGRRPRIRYVSVPSSPAGGNMQSYSTKAAGMYNLHITKKLSLCDPRHGTVNKLP